MLARRSTRGRTAAGRLRGLDAYLLGAHRPLLSAPGGLFIDLGLGDSPSTTIELAAALHALNPSAHITGIDSDPARVSAAQPSSRPPFLRFLPGGFDSLPAPARLIRMMNVLRGYRADELEAARSLVRSSLAPDGLLLEGSSDPRGALLTAHLLRRSAYDGLLFFTTFDRGFAPLMFRDWLPRDLRRSVRPGTAIHSLLHAWTATWQPLRASTTDLPALFHASATAAGLRVPLPGTAIWDGAPRSPSGSPSP